MSTLSIQITYRKGRPFAAYIYLPHAPGTKSARTELIGFAQAPGAMLTRIQG